MGLPEPGSRDFSGGDSLSCLRRQRGVTPWPGLKSRGASSGRRVASDRAPPPPARCGRTRETNLRDVVDGIFYIAQTGCQWRLMPKDSPPYTTAQRYFYAWRDNGVWQTINQVLLTYGKPLAGRRARALASSTASRSRRPSLVARA